MAARNTDIILSNGNVVSIATYNYDYIAGTGTIGYFLSTGNISLPTCFNISGYDPKGDLTDAEKYLLSRWADVTTVQSAQYQTAIEHLKNGVTWIWGNGELGGLYVRKTSSTKCKVGGLTGLLKNSTDTEQIYVIRETPEMTLSECTDLCLMYSESSINEEIAGCRSVSLFTTADLHNNGQGDPAHHSYYSYANFQVGATLYSEMYNLTDMRSCTRSKDHYEILDHDYPSQVFTKARWSESLTPPHQLVMQIFGTLIQSGEHFAWGDMWGGQAGDDEDDPNANSNSSAGDGGGGDYPSSTSGVDTSDASSMAVDIVNSGFVTLYNPTLAQVKNFNDFLFLDITEVISLQLKRLVANPLDYVLFLALCHFTPPTNGISENIYYAGINTNVAAKKITNQYYTFSCGTVHIAWDGKSKKDWTGGDTKTFLDFNNNTKISIYLPAIGIKELNTDDLIGCDIEVVYNVDMLTGVCIAEIKCTRPERLAKGDANLDDVIYNFSGNCFETIPLTAVDWRGFISSALQLVGGVSAVAAGNPAGVGAIANAIMSEKVSVSKSGNLAGSSGYMSHQKPYLILERPINNLPYNFRDWEGYTSNIRVNELKDVSGYTEITDLWLDGFDGMLESEAVMLKNLFKDGVYLNW